MDQGTSNSRSLILGLIISDKSQVFYQEIIRFTNPLLVSANCEYLGLVGCGKDESLTWAEWLRRVKLLLPLFTTVLIFLLSPTPQRGANWIFIVCLDLFWISCLASEACQALVIMSDSVRFDNTSTGHPLSFIDPKMGFHNCCPILIIVFILRWLF